MKRGYRSPDQVKASLPKYEQPNDPYFQYQWYLVREKTMICFSI